MEKPHPNRRHRHRTATRTWAHAPISGSHAETGGVIGVDRPPDPGDHRCGGEPQHPWPRITMTLRALKAMASRKPEKGKRKKDRLPRRLFKQKGRAPAIPPGSKVVYEPAGREKMSE